MVEVLIYSSELDKINTEAVEAKVHELGSTAFVLSTDRVLSGETPVAIGISNNGTRLLVNNEEMDVNSISCWFRRPSNFSERGESIRDQSVDELIMRKALNEEIDSAIEDLVGVIPDYRFLNPRLAVRAADVKYRQLLLARQIGFEIPDTFETNVPGYIDFRVPRIGKTHHGLSFPGRKGKSESAYSFAKTLTPDSIEGMRMWPCIIQEKLEKAREWRITVVGDDIFPAAIYSTGEGSTDWRKAQLDNGSVRFVAENPSDEVLDRCFQIVRGLGQRYGCIDLIETTDGRTVFLEDNSNGQFMFIEKRLGYPISESIAANLIRIARS